MRLPILVLHICAGTLGLLSGAVAMSFRKGARGHRVAGNVFVISMLCMAAAAVYLAAMKHDNNNIGGGILTFYLVATAWATARRRDGQTSIFDWGALLVPLALGIGSWIHGIQMVQAGSKEGSLRVGMTFFMGSMLLLAAVGDVRMLVRGGVFGRQRVVRHLWRMCLGLFIATGSLFLGQQQVFPAFLRETNVLLILAFLPLILLIFWLFRVRFTSAYKRMSMPREGDAYSLRT